MGMPLFYNSYDGDREYDAESATEWLRPFFTTGVFNGGMQVKANGNMSVNVGEGYCNIGGKTKHFEEETTLDIEIASGTLNRIDNVVLRRDDANRDIYLMIQKGGNAKTPSAPKIVRDGAIYDLKLAEIFIAAGTIKITQANITDCRMLSDVCGWVVATVDEIDFTQIQAQFDCYLEQFEEDQVDEFTRWFDGIKKQFTDDAVGGLQTQINETKREMDNLTPGDIGAVSVKDSSTSFIYVTLKETGWYRIAKYVSGNNTVIGQGSYGQSCSLSLKRSYNTANNEYHEVSLRSIFQKSSFKETSGFSNGHYLTKIRHVYDSRDKNSYIEVFYNCSGENGLSVNIWNSKTHPTLFWEAIEPIKTSETVEGVTVYSSIDLKANTKGSVSEADHAVGADNSNFLKNVGSSVNLMPSDNTVGYSAGINNSNGGVLPRIDNSNSVMTFGRHPGDYYSQFGFSGNGRVYYRSTNNKALSDSVPWNRLAYTGETLQTNAYSKIKHRLLGQPADYSEVVIGVAKAKDENGGFTGRLYFERCSGIYQPKTVDFYMKPKYGYSTSSYGEYAYCDWLSMGRDFDIFKPCKFTYNGVEYLGFHVFPTSATSTIYIEGWSYDPYNDFEPFMVEVNNRSTGTKSAVYDTIDTTDSNFVKTPNLKYNGVSIEKGGEIIFSGKSSTTSFPAATLSKSIAEFKRVKIYYSPPISFYTSASREYDYLIGEAQVTQSALGSYVAHVHMFYTCDYEQYFCGAYIYLEGNKLSLWEDKYLNNGVIYKDNGGGKLPYKGVVKKVIGYYE